MVFSTVSLDDIPMSNIVFHHFGLAVKSFSKATAFYKNLGYQATEPIYDPLQDVELVLCTSETQPAVEFVKPVGDESPVSNYLNKNNEMIYHTCYEVDVIGQDVEVLFQANRAICVSKPKPAVLFNNRLVSFYYVSNVGLIELLER
jgi:methylmalonyl-CoA/ethylmalonyl-CoA epimerase